MACSRLSNLLREASILADRLEEVHRSYAVNTSAPDLSAALIALSTTLVSTQNLVQTATVQGTHEQSICSLSCILETSLPILQSHLRSLEQIAQNRKHHCTSGRLRDTRSVTKQHMVIEKMQQSIHSIAADLSHHKSLLAAHHIDIAPDLSCSATNPQRHCQMQHQPKHDPIPRASILLRRLEADRDHQDKHVHFDDEPPNLTVPELAGSCTWPAEVAGSTPGPPPVLVGPFIGSRAPGGCLGAASTASCRTENPLVPNVPVDTNYSGVNADEEILELAPSPPPPYESIRCTMSTDDRDSPQVLESNDSAFHENASPASPNPHANASNEAAWVNPITEACRETMQQYLPTATPTLFQDLACYHQSMRNRAEYRWYLNFRYTSICLPLFLPAQVFLVDLNFIYPDEGKREQNGLSSILAYIFEDSIVFAKSPCVSILPDPHHKENPGNEADASSTLLDSGLEVLEDHSIRFAHLCHVTRKGKYTLVLECQGSSPRSGHIDCQAITEDTHVVKIRFRTTCQTSKVFNIMQPWSFGPLVQSEIHIVDTDYETPGWEGWGLPHQCHCCRHKAGSSINLSTLRSVTVHHDHHHHRCDYHRYADYGDNDATPRSHRNDTIVEAHCQVFCSTKRAMHGHALRTEFVGFLPPYAC